MTLNKILQNIYFTIANVLSRTHVLVIAMVASKMAKSDKFTTGDKNSPQLSCQRACTICMGSKSPSVNHRPKKTVTAKIDGSAKDRYSL